MGKDLRGRDLGKGISQRKGGRYEVRYTDRFGNRRSIYASSLGEAKQLLREASENEKRERSVRKRYPLRDWYLEWMRVYKMPVIRPNTVCQYRQIIEKHILPALGDMYMDEIRQIDVKNLINSLDREGYQWETQNKVRLLLSDMFRVAMENDYAVKNPTKGVKLSKAKPDERIVLTAEEQEEFMECSAGTFYGNLFRTAVKTGLRPGEICALTEDDIDFANKTISVTKTLLYQKLEGDDKKEFHLGPPKTDSSVRVIPMNKEAEKALKKQVVLKKLLSDRYPKCDEFAELLFVTKFNTPICSQVLCDAIKRITDEINLQRDSVERFPEFSAHTFRHTFATRWIEKGGNPKALQKILGHANLKMTMDLYVHATNEFEQSEMAKVEGETRGPDDLANDMAEQESEEI